MFRTLFLTFITITVCGCQTYHTDLALPANIERITVEPIKSNDVGYGQLLTDHLKQELGKHFIITTQKPDLIISGAATQTTLSTNGQAIFVLRTESHSVGTISITESPIFFATARNIAKKIKNILTKNR